MPAKKPVTFEGVTYESISEMARVLGVSHNCAKKWVKVGERLTTGKRVIFEGVEYASKKEAARKLGINYSSFCTMTAKGATERRENPGVTFEGKWYPSSRAMAESFGITETVANNWRANGKRSSKAKFVTGWFEGKFYNSAAELARELGINDVTAAIWLKKGERGPGSGCVPTEEVTFEGVKYKDRRDLAEKLGVSYSIACDWLRAGRRKTGGSSYLRPALADIRRIVADLGDQIHAMDQKSWLIILQQAEGINAIGSQSQLTPTKLKMLRGEYEPQDYIPADGEEYSKVEQDLIAAANDETEPEIQPAIAQEIETVDESEEQQVRLARLTPAQHLMAVNVATAIMDDPEAIQKLVGHRIEKIWSSLFRALPEHRDAMVLEMAMQVPENAYVVESVRNFMAEWQAIQGLMEQGIPGVTKPEGGDLNLMQYREAALLQADRARMNLSDMGAGKTLSSIAGMQLSGASRVLVLCPNNTIPSFVGQLGQFLPSASTATKTWAPFFGPDDHPQWVINNLEMLQDRYREELKLFLDRFNPDGIVVDEVHLCKVTNADNPSQRRQILGELCDWARENKVVLYAMSGTPVVNKLSEAVDLVRMIRPELAAGLKTQHTINNCLDVHNAIQPFVTRYVPQPFAARKPRRIDVNADHLVEEALQASRHCLTLDATLAEAKVDALVKLAKEPGKLLVFTTPVTGVVDPVVDALTDAGIRAVRHTGEEKFEGADSTVDLFINDPSVKVLVASTSTLSTGVDGLQSVCGRCVFLTLPWTPAEYDQAVARLVRQGTAFSAVEITTIYATLTDPNTGEDWSLDQQKMDILTSKRTVAAAVTDGITPTSATLAFNLKSVTKACRNWAERLQTA